MIAPNTSATYAPTSGGYNGLLNGASKNGLIIPSLAGRSNGRKFLLSTTGGGGAKVRGEVSAGEAYQSYSVSANVIATTTSTLGSSSISHSSGALASSLLSTVVVTSSFNQKTTTTTERCSRKNIIVQPQQHQVNHVSNQSLLLCRQTNAIKQQQLQHNQPLPSFLSELLACKTAGAVATRKTVAGGGSGASNSGNSGSSGSGSGNCGVVQYSTTSNHFNQQPAVGVSTRKTLQQHQQLKGGLGGFSRNSADGATALILHNQNQQKQLFPPTSSPPSSPSLVTAAAALAAANALLAGRRNGWRNAE